MQHYNANLTQLYLPLLLNPAVEVRRQAWTILRASHGLRALTQLRRMLDTPDPHLRQQIQQALRAIAEMGDVAVEIRPFEGMYVECLGRLRVYIGSYPLQPSDWAQLDGGRAGALKVQSVFAYLIHCGKRGATREAIGESVWGGSVSASSLSRTLTALRQILERAGDAAFVEQALSISRDYCILAPDEYSTDAQMFERAFGIADQLEHSHDLASAVPVYTQALELYGGPYMADVAHGNGWWQSRRDVLMNSFIITIERLAEYAYTNGRYHQCIALCQQAIDTDQSADDVTVWVIRAYAALQQFAEVEHAYRRYLRATGINPNTVEGRQDTVVQVYEQLGADKPLNKL
jgi:two-component SAPR family response regulator